MTAYRVRIDRLPDPAQPTLFDAKALRPVTPARAPVEDRKRLSRQCESILARLRQGPASNRELSALALKYGGRISDLRAAGFRIHCERREEGRTVYTLVVP